MKHSPRLLLASLALAGVSFVGSPMWLSGAAAATQPAAQADPVAKGDKVKVTFKDGRTPVEGVVVELTDDIVRLSMKAAIGMSEQIFSRLDIASIDKVSDSAPDAAAGAPAAAPANTIGSMKTDDKPAGGAKPADPNQKVIYLMNFKGDFGHDESPTPLTRAMADVKKVQPDYLVVKIDCDFAIEGNKVDDNNLKAMTYAYDEGLDKSAEMDLILTDTGSWAKKPKLIMWVKRAVGPSCFVPFICEDIYFTSDGKQGGIGYLDHIFDGMGDETPRRKQQSLRLGRAEGLAIKGKHDYRLVRAMSYSDYILSVSFVGGEPVYHNDMSGDEILTDGGQKNGHPDTVDQILRFEGNDVLTLNAKKAVELKYAKGVVNNMDELAYELGISRDFRVTGQASDTIFKNWKKEVEQGEDQLESLWNDFNTTPVTGATADERNAVRSRLIQILEKMKRIMARYGESISRRRLQLPTEEADLDLIIERLRQAIRLDK